MKLGPDTMVAGRYRIERELGRGGMGSVYVAFDTKFDERIALKIAAASGAAREEFERRFAREARIGHRLGRLPGFVRAIDWGRLEDGISLYLAMDLVDDARSLDLSSGSRAERLRRLLAATRLVEIAHRNGILHRDLKPANFLQDPGGTIHLTDFGLAKTHDEDPSAVKPASGDLTQSGIGLGTPHYMAPEQFDDAKSADERADVYSLGVMLYKALVGEHPYPGGKLVNIWHLQERVRRGMDPAPRPGAIDPTVPAGLDALCARAIALDRAERPSAAELVAGLEAALRGEAATPADTAAAEPDSLAATVPPPSRPEPGSGSHPTHAEGSSWGPSAASAEASTQPPAPSATSAVAPRLPRWVPRALACCGALALTCVCCVSGFLLDAGGVQGKRPLSGSLTAMGYGALPGFLVSALDTRAPELSLQTPESDLVDWTTKPSITLPMLVREAALARLELVVDLAGEEGTSVVSQPFPVNRYAFSSRRELELPKPGRYEVQVRAVDRAGHSTTHTHEVWRITDARRLVTLDYPTHTRARAIRVRGRLAVRLVPELRLGGRAIPVDEQGRFELRLRLQRGRRTYHLQLAAPRGEVLERDFTIERRPLR